MKKSKKAEGTVIWPYIVAAILALAFLFIGFIIITGMGGGLRGFIERIKEFL